jgi:uncharacterized membrane protein YhaH (DUF805 family)
MGFQAAIAACLSKYVTFQGRAMRSEYWYFALFMFIVDIVAYALDMGLFGRPILNSLASLAFILPSLAVSVRRLHDTDRSGWWIFINLIPLIGVILYLVWMCTKGTAGANRFGEEPR